jgi:hypothetical protein
MLRRTLLAWMVAALWTAGEPALANDPWEAAGDDGPGTVNLLRHGIAQRGHDLEGPAATPDVDYMRIVTKERHSYEARVSGLYWESGCSVAPCPRFDRTSASGALLTAGTPSNDDIDRGEASLGLTVRWIATAGAEERLRATGDQLVALHAERYDVVFYDTTLFVPRWNNSATQTTVLLLQNTTNAVVTGAVSFHSAAGALLGTAEVDVPRFGVQVIPTAAIGALAGQSGSAEIAQLGGYGALAGKAVALEPATGFTFDTPVLPLPR